MQPQNIHKDPFTLLLTHSTYARLQKQLFIDFPHHKHLLSSIQLSIDGIINKPNQIPNLFESQELANTDSNRVVAGWISLLHFLIQIIEKMPINACLLYQNCKFKTKESKQIDIFVFTTNKIDEFIGVKHKISTKDQDPKIITQAQQALGLLFKLTDLFFANCPIRQNSLHPITQNLCIRYHHDNLTIQALDKAYRLICLISKNEKKPFKVHNCFKGDCYKPFFFMDGKCKVGVRLLLSDNQWMYNQYLHIALWLTPYQIAQQSTKTISLLYIKTDDDKSLRVIQERKQIAVECQTGEQKSYRKVCDLPINCPVKLEIKLDGKQGGVFKQRQYKLHIVVNNQQYSQIEVKVPKFSTSSYITDFNFLQNYFGLFYSVCMAPSQLNFPDSLVSDSEISTFCIDPQSLSVVMLLSPLKVHKGILINQHNSQKNQGCYQASYTSNKIQPTKQIYNTSEISLPFLYFCCCLYQSPQLVNFSQQDKALLDNLFNTILSNLCFQLFQNANFQINSILNNIQLSNLFILYFLELAAYPITQSTLNTVVDYCCIDNYSGFYLKRYLDFNGVICERQLNSKKALIKYNQKKIDEINQKIEANEISIFSTEAQLLKSDQLNTYNPVTKVQLLFLLETQWKKLWNKIQSISEWWNPYLKFQRDQPFDDTIYEYKKDAKEQGSVGFSWVVSEFITNDFCDVLLVPQIEVPKQGDFNHYRDMYVHRQCMSEDFDEPDLWKCLINLGKGVKKRKYYFKPNHQSLSKKIKNEIYAPPNPMSVTEIYSQSMPVDNTKEADNYFKAPVCFINLLTLVIGTISIRINSEEENNSAVISFSPKHFDKGLDHLCIKVFKYETFPCVFINCTDIKMLRKRRYNQSMNGLQIRLKSGVNYLFYFYEQAHKYIDRFINQLCPNILPLSVISKNPYEEYLKSNYTIKWIDRQLSNYEYLQQLNDISGRSYSDITQYPVVPWVFISNDEQIDLGKQESYRDLTKNMGSLGPQQRRSHFLEKYQNHEQTEIFTDYHFGTHYSSSAIICNFLIRLKPFSTGAISLQSGKFDCADRVYSSYIGSWLNAISSTTDIRELIPQVYILPEMMINVNNYDFGVTQLKERICNVQLPRWANKNPYIFCCMLRKTLQRENISSNIKHWIDLIYGYKQKGKAAVESMNLFFPLTYQLAINLQKIGDKDERESFETQIAHFGQNPAQIIGNNPHPQILALKTKWENKLIADCNELLIQRCNLQKWPKKSSENFIYESVFGDENSILAIKFIRDNLFIVVRRYQLILFKIVGEEVGFIIKQKQIQNTIYSQANLDYQNIESILPTVIIDDDAVIVGGFHHGNLQIIYIQERQIKSYGNSGNLQFPLSTITALDYNQQYKFLYVGDSTGKLAVYEFELSNKETTLTQRFFDKVHELKINSIRCNYRANLFVTSSDDGCVKIFNLYSQQMYRKISSPFEGGVIFGQISCCPLYCVIFYSKNNSRVYSYSINGQFLASKNEQTGLICNIKIESDSNHAEYAISLNKNREISIDQLPFLHQKKKIRLKRDDYSVSCFETVKRIAIAGTQSGTLQIIADPSSY